MPNYLPLTSAARSAGLSPRTIRDWAARGILPTTTTKGTRSRLVDLDVVRQIAAARGMPTADSALPAQHDFAPDGTAALVPSSDRAADGGMVAAAEVIMLRARLDAFSATYSELPQALVRLDVQDANSSRLAAELHQLRWMLAGLAALLVVTLIINVVVLLTR